MKNHELPIPSVDRLSKFETQEAFVSYTDDKGNDFEIDLADPNNPDNKNIQSLVTGRDISRQFHFPHPEQLRLKKASRYHFRLFVEKKLSHKPLRFKIDQEMVDLLANKLQSAAHKALEEIIGKNHYGYIGLQVEYYHPDAEYPATKRAVRKVSRNGSFSRWQDEQGHSLKLEVYKEVVYAKLKTARLWGESLEIASVHKQQYEDAKLAAYAGSMKRVVPLSDEGDFLVIRVAYSGEQGWEDVQIAERALEIALQDLLDDKSIKITK